MGGRRQYSHGVVLPGRVRPAPTYPEYVQLLADAAAQLAAEEPT